MKRIFFVLAVFLLPRTAQAWEVGDYYNLDGVPSIVVWVDSTGEHGLRLSPAASSITCKPKNNLFYRSDVSIGRSADFLKAQGKMGEKLQNGKIFQGASKESLERWTAYHELYEQIVEFQNQHLWSKKKTKNAISVQELFNTNSEYGEINMKAVLAFCENNNYDMETYFPSYYWATNLGDKWFIPGAYEVELISRIITDGIGIEREKTVVSAALKEYQTKAGGPYFYDVFNIQDMLSSTFILSDWAEDPDNKDKLGHVESTEEAKGQWYDYKRQYEECVNDYFGSESSISLVFRLLKYTAKLGLKSEDYLEYYLLMKNATPLYINAVCYF